MQLNMKNRGFSCLKTLSVDKEWANEQLRFAIAVLMGKWGWNEPHCWKYRLILAKIILRRLEESGFWWQAKILGYWINRFKRGDFTAPKELTRPPYGKVSVGGASQ